jgi:methionine synthase I (cobalamin-dependent)
MYIQYKYFVGADIYETDTYGNTALYFAKTEEIKQLLIKTHESISVKAVMK